MHFAEQTIAVNPALTQELLIINTKYDNLCPIIFKYSNFFHDEERGGATRAQYAYGVAKWALNRIAGQ